MTDVKWLTKQAVLAMHARQLAEHGGGAGLRDEGLLESALQRPLDKSYYGTPDLFELAAAYAYGIARNHPFVDGNKRTALVASRTFLLINGFTVAAPKEELLRTFLSLADGSLGEEELGGWFRKFADAVSK
jgi:death-on-curing protein